MAEFLCLANSLRDNERCVAGLVPGQGWVRPVPDRAGSAVAQAQVEHFGLLDVVEVDLGGWVPITGQPENRLLGPAGFSDVSAHLPARLEGEMEDLIERRPELLERGRPDRISHDELGRNRIGRSLALVEPESVQWRVVPPNSYSGRRVRCQFDMGWGTFDLAVTDVDIRQALGWTDAGLHDRGTADIPDDHRVLLTISLGGDFQGNHYKLVAAVIALDR